MPVSVTAKRRILFALMLLVGANSLADNFSVQSAQIQKSGNDYILNAKIKYPLTPRIIEAIDNGVPITFLQQFELVHSIPLLGKYWQWENTLWTSTLRYELRYHALSNQYILITLGAKKRRNFISLKAALAELGNIESLALPPKHLSDTSKLILRVRSGLDLYSLPAPMRPGALISSKWQINSPWTNATWP